VVLAGTVLAVQPSFRGAVLNIEDSTNLFGSFLATSAINWTWNSFISGGPVCNDISKRRIPDLTKDQKDFIVNSLDKMLAEFEAKPAKLATGTLLLFKDELVFSKCAGVKSWNSTEKPDEDTVFAVASLTKMFTTLMLNMLSEQGVLDISDPVTKYFNEQDTPAFKSLNPFDSVMGSSAVTLESIAGQVCGLTRENPCFGDIDSCTEKMNVEAGNKVPLLHRPFTRPHYSNYGFSLLGHSCERAARNAGITEWKYEEWLKKNVFDPLGMNSTGFDFPAEIKDRMAEGYNDEEGNVSPTFAQTLGWGNPGGGMYSTMKDVTSFMRHLLKRDMLLSQNGFEQYFHAGFLMRDGVSSFGKNGWEICYSNGFKVLTKSGSAGGFSIEIVIIPELEFGTFSWYNIGGIYPAETTAKIVNMFVPIVLNNIENEVEKRPVPDVIDEILGEYAGNSPTEHVTIKRDDNSKKTNLFIGEMGSFSVVYEYDPDATKIMNIKDTYYFRYYVAGNKPCFVIAGSGADNGLAAFQKDGGKWTVTSADQMYFRLARKDVAPSSSSVPTSASSSLCISLAFVFVSVLSWVLCLFNF